jgi:hypothetical protein
MQFKNLVYIVLFLVISFILNIFFYFISSDYRDFLRNIKSDNTEVSNLELENIEEVNKITKNKKTNTDNNNYSVISDATKIDTIKSKTNNIEEIKVEYNSIIDKVKETKIEKDFLARFKEYKLKKLELHPRLFDLTTEYPDEYIEYYSEYLTVYFFGNKPYDDIKDIFKVLTYELPFTINEVDNFGDKSFYINLNPEFQDDQVRIVLLYKNRTFGLKMTKEVYSMIRDKLSRLK